MSKKKINPKTQRLFNESYQYRLNERKTKSSLSQLIYRLPFSLVATASNYSQLFYGCDKVETDIKTNIESLKNTSYIGFDYEKHCDGYLNTCDKNRKKIISKKNKYIKKICGNFFTLFFIY